MDVALFGVNHRTAPVAVRERFARSSPDVASWLAASGRRTGLDEAVVLSTCNRMELYGAVHGREPAAEHTRRAFLSLVGEDAVLEGGSYVHSGLSACRHGMRVAAGLDSLVLGERQILGQVKEAYATSRDTGAAGPILDRMFGAMFHAAKRVQTETDLATGAVSVASAAVLLAEGVLGSLAGRNVVLVGAGEMATIAARHIAKRGPGQLTIVNRTLARVEELAAHVGAEALPLDSLAALLSEADLVVCATRAPGHLVSASMARGAVSGRAGGSLVFVDIGVPRNVDPASADVGGVFVYPIDALSSVVDRGRERRTREALRAEAIVEEEAARFGAWTASLEAVPLVRDLREHFERMRAEEVRRSLKHFAPGEREHVERLTRALVNRLLHAPTARLKAGGERQVASLDEAVRELFALDEVPCRRQSSARLRAGRQEGQDGRHG